MLFVQRHILRLGQLETPYKVIAADVSGNQEISIVDIIVMRRMILGIVDEWNDGVEWKFVDANTTFFDPAKPWPFNRTIEIPNATDSSCDNNFIGIKIGDVDNSYEALETRNNVGQTLQYRSSETSHGSTVYSFSLHESSTVFGFQFSLDQIEDAGFHIESDVIDIGHDHFNIENDNAHVSWTNPYGQYINANEILFSIEIAQAKTELQLNENRLKSEIYSGKNIDAKHLTLEQLHDTDQSQFSITPNPFTDNVFVQLDAKQLSKIEINIFTIDGQRLWNLSEQYQTGNHQIEIPGSIFNGSGMYYYSVSIDGKNYSGKIVKE